MKYSEFKRWLEKQGAELIPHRSGSSHFRVVLNGLESVFPYHGSKEMGKGLAHKIKKDLGLK